MSAGMRGDWQMMGWGDWSKSNGYIISVHDYSSFAGAGTSLHIPRGSNSNSEQNMSQNA